MLLVATLGISLLLWYAFIAVLCLGAFVFTHSILSAQLVDQNEQPIASQGLQPVSFPEANVTFAKDQPEYKPLPAFVNAAPEGEVITCWQIKPLERVKLLFTGKIWLMSMTFNQPLQPLYLTIHKRDVLVDPKAVDPKQVGQSDAK